MKPSKTESQRFQNTGSKIMKTQFQVAVSRSIKSKTLLSYEMALNAYESLAVKASRGCEESQNALESIKKAGF